MQIRKRELAAALIIMPLFVLSGCSGKQKTYVAGLEAETVSAATSGQEVSGSADTAQTGTSGSDVTQTGAMDSDASQAGAGASDAGASRTGTGVSDAGASRTGAGVSDAGASRMGAGASDAGVTQIGTGVTDSGVSQAESDTADSDVAQTAYVHVCGAVQNPGVYPVEPGMRIYEAISLAGGLTENADADWLNQAETMEDGQQIYVYTTEETAQLRQSGSWPDRDSPSGGAEAAKGSSDNKINLNTATKEELTTLPGIGEARAEAVIAYREEHGGFGSIEEIQNISGIKTAVFSKIKDKITV